ncbi:hypothetical protein AGLY_011382 [Aphis glycines]|uniref:HAT C-terminal dimerisation domain-containing protein n=1 Tax=Aphis glycines TaxID=307491 RepID=A0A6G0TD94_APHGL|nr:hypothetical protein AGLY_011382 [Aphis glycines]
MENKISVPMVFEKHNEHKGENFLKLFSKIQPNIIKILNDQRLKQKKQNRSNILPIIKCVILCGRQELSQRGHRDFKMVNILNISIPRRHRTNLNVKDANGYYRITVAIPYIDFFIQQLNERFCAIKIYFKSSYSNDFGELITFDFDKFFIYKKCLKSSAQETLRLCENEILPNYYHLLKILCTLPVSTATPEKTFSCLKRLTNYLRSTMIETRLNELTILAVHKEISIIAEEVLDKLAKKPRKLDFIL